MIMDREEVINALSEALREDLDYKSIATLKKIRIAIAYSNVVYFKSTSSPSLEEIPFPCAEQIIPPPLKNPCSEHFITGKGVKVARAIKTEYLSHVYGCPKVLEVEG